MLNIEKYENELRKYGTYFALTKEGKLVTCEGLACKNCSFDGGCPIKRMNWLLEEYKEPILNNEEKEILNQLVVANSVISNKKLVYVQKVLVSNYSNKSCLLLMFEDCNGIYTARFNTDCIFKRMEDGKRYILEELGL